jgi:hypothetical protein
LADGSLHIDNGNLEFRPGQGGEAQGTKTQDKSQYSLHSEISLIR